MPDFYSFDVLYYKMVEYKKIKNTTTFIHDTSFDSKRIDDHYLSEAYIPEEYNLKISGEVHILEVDNQGCT